MFKLNNFSFSLAQREYLGIFKKFYSYVKFLLRTANFFVKDYLIRLVCCVKNEDN